MTELSPILEWTGTLKTTNKSGFGVSSACSSILARVRSTWIFAGCV